MRVSVSGSKAEIIAAGRDLPNLIREISDVGCMTVRNPFGYGDDTRMSTGT